MLNNSQKKALLKRIGYVTGQMARIERMEEDERDPTDIHT
jgi:DNA-binding FrmR family transcriptional regulator